MQNEKCLIIAEAGVNHNGNLDLAFQLCDAAKKAGADVVKFQTWKTEKIITSKVKQAEYQSKNTRKKESQFDMLKKLELTYESFQKIKRYCDEIGIIFASTADEEESLDFLIDIGIPFIKVGSGDIANVSFLRYIGTKTLPVILSTGMSSLSDVDISVRALQDGGTKDITLLHCTTNYPCLYKEVNLRAIKTLREAFHAPIGYSDHTEGIEVPIAAVVMGAKVLEKHFTLDRTMEGPDHAASMEPGDFRKMVNAIRNIEESMGDGIKRLKESEVIISGVVKKRIVAARPIKKGQIIKSADICVKRSSVGLTAENWDLICGCTAQKDYIPDEAIWVL